MNVDITTSTETLYFENMYCEFICFEIWLQLKKMQSLLIQMQNLFADTQNKICIAHIQVVKKRTRKASQAIKCKAAVAGHSRDRGNQ